VELNKQLIAKDPKEDIIQEGVIGIDFGTKSTVVVFQQDNEHILPMRVGIGDWTKPKEKKHYENPTVMEFRNFSEFWNDYNELEFRPFTKWEDLTISHTAYNNMRESSNSKDFNSYLTELKQWAGDSNRKIRIEDKQKTTSLEIPPFLEVGEVNPIELYAYYLGLYINNQHNGIYLDYILSFPVTYEKKVRDKILESFKKGLKKSIPDIGEKIEDLRVVAGASEPAAYASIALQKYGFDEEEKTVYAIFDFGGGTTDFDFGIFRFANEDNPQEEEFDYVIEHFGAGGDKYLGGENLLELLAFEIFKDNQSVMLEKNMSFTLPPEAKKFAGSELLLDDSREARLNMVTLMNKLREFWERESFEEKVFEDDIKLTLHDNTGKVITDIEIEVDEEKLKNILTKRIERGVDNFFEAMREAFYHHSDELNLDTEEINIFLAGNSSKSPIVKEIFDKKIAEFRQKIEEKGAKGDIKIFPPLTNDDNIEEPNGKTGVAFGLIETREGGTILVIDRNKRENNEIKFKYYLGKNRRKKFNVVLDREVPFGEWRKFSNTSKGVIEVYFTSQPSATTNQMSISETKRKRIKVSSNSELNLYIRFKTPTIFEYVVADEEGISEEIYQTEIKEMELKDE